MSIDILNMRRFDENAHAIDVALPVLAVECEAALPVANKLDAYEEAVLKLISLGLSAKGVAKTMNATESLIDDVLSHLSARGYVQREIGKPWMLTEDGEKFLSGKEDEDSASKDSQYGYMFINSIKKEVLPFFYLGDIGKISLFRGELLPLKLTLEGDEKNTFAPLYLEQAKLKKAYKAFYRNLKTINSYCEREISRDEAIELFEGLDSFDEEIYENQEAQATEEKNNTGELKPNMFIRPLAKTPTKLYLRMRIVINPSLPGGYRAESPFDFYGIDDNFFMRQVQWLEQLETTYIGGTALQEFLQKEICKLSPSYKTSAKDFRVFVLEKVPLLKIYKSKFSYIYHDLERIYELMQRQNSLLEKENIVSNLARCVVEGLFNAYFGSIDSSRLEQIRQKATNDLGSYGNADYKKIICQNIGFKEDGLQWVKYKYLNTILNRLNKTYGNSIVEKFINMMVVEYHLGNVQIHKFFSENDVNETYDLVNELNRIRRKVSHDTKERFSSEDYVVYMDNVFVLINRLLDGFREE